mmetsp:Transcript_87295/g.236639  ORF Transcript_87295/g.236639 Transcript_87295/m.236639 type:complete len:206 (+) Transcript_87295:931-1548(+)
MGFFASAAAARKTLTALAFSAVHSALSCLASLSFARFADCSTALNREPMASALPVSLLVWASALGLRASSPRSAASSLTLLRKSSNSVLAAPSDSSTAASASEAALPASSSSASDFAASSAFATLGSRSSPRASSTFPAFSFSSASSSASRLARSAASLIRTRAASSSRAMAIAIFRLWNWLHGTPLSPSANLDMMVASVAAGNS